MALESQGIDIRRSGTAASDTAVKDATGLAVIATGIVNAHATADFAADGFTTGMRLEISSTSAHNKGVYTIKSVAATVMGFYEPACTADDNTGIYITGNKYYSIGHVVGFNGPTGNAAVIYITSLQSTAKEKMIGIRDEGQITFDINFSASAGDYHLSIKDDRANRTLRKWDINLTDRTTVTGHIPSALNFDGYVTGFAISGSVDNIIKGSLTLEITSAVKWISEGS